MPSDKTPRLPSRNRTSSAQKNSGTFIALFGLLGLGLALLSLMATVLPQVRGLILVIAAAGSFFAIHYLIWGHWLNRIVDRDPPDEFPPPSAG